METKIVVIGAPGVGKSASVIQFTQHHFIEEYDPTIEDSYRKRCMVDEEACLLDILDTAASEFPELRAAYMRTGHGFIAIYDVTSRRSFEELQSYIDFLFISRDTSAATFPIIIAGNKTDLTGRQVSFDEGQKLAKSCHAKFFETSAKNRINIDEIFLECRRQCTLIERKPDVLKGRYRSSVAFIGDKHSCVGDVLGEITKTTPEVKPSIESDIMSWSVKGSGYLTVASREFPSLTHCISSTQYPNLAFLCFSVVNRSSFEQAMKQWTQLKGTRCCVFVGTKVEVREWLEANQTKPSKSAKKSTSKDTTEISSAYHPFDTLPEEVIVHIFTFMPLLDNVIFTCKRFSKVAQHPSLSSIRSGTIQLPVVTKTEVEDATAKSNGSLYVEVSLSQRTGLNELSLDALFAKYLKDEQDQDILAKVGTLGGSTTKKKKKKKFFFF